MADSHESRRDRQIRVARVIAEARSRRAAGETLSDERVIADHADLMPELGEMLAEAQAEPVAATRADDARGEEATRDDLNTRAPVDVPSGDPLADLTQVLAKDNSDVPPISIPGYSIIRRLSQGGQAVVYLAVQISTGRKVAIKVMWEGPYASVRGKARWEREAQILASLEHPNIVSLIDRGVTERGDFYFVMNYVEGQTLSDCITAHHRSTTALAEGDFDPSRMLRLFVRIAAAVNAAHLRGIVHRDLKPSNIIVDARDEPHVLDFGLARTGIVEMTDESQPAPITLTGNFMGSLPWSSPEQAEGLPDKIDTRTDVYSLGVILYQMLTGEFPYEVVGNMRDVLDNIMRAEPTPPSRVLEARLAKEAQRQKRFRRKHSSPISRDLEAIVLKALSKRREARYQTAGEFARDVEDYLAGKAISASADRGTRRERLTYLRAIAASLVAVLLLVGGVVLTRGLFSRGDASDAGDKSGVKGSSFDAGGAPDAVDNASRTSTGDEPNIPSEAQAPRSRGDPISTYSLVASPATLPGVRAWTIETRGHRDTINTVAHSPDGLLVASAGSQGVIHIWNAESAQLIAMFYGGQVHELAWAPGGRYLATAGWRKIAIWDVSERKLVRDVMMESAGKLRGIDWSHDGRYIAAGGDDRTVHLIDTATGSEVDRLIGNENYIYDLAWSRNGAWIATGGEDKTVRLWSATEHKLVRTIQHVSSVLSLAFSPDDQLLAIGDKGGRIMLFSVATGQPISTRREMRQSVTTQPPFVRDLAFSPDGARLASAADDGVIRFWDVATGESLVPWKKHADPIIALSWSSKGESIVTGGGEGNTLRFWDAATGAVKYEIVGHAQSRCNAVAWSPDGAQIAVDHGDSTWLWDPAWRERPTKYFDRGSTALRWSPDGNRMALRDTDYNFGVVNPGGRYVRVEAPKSQSQGCLDWLPDSAHVVVAGREQVRIADATTGKVVRDLPTGIDVIPEGLSVSPDGRWIAVSFSGTQLAQIWDTDTWAKAREWKGVKQDSALLIAWCPVGDRFVIGSAWMEYLQNWPDPKPWIHLYGDRPLGASPSRALQWSRDGQTLATGRAGSITLWDVNTVQKRSVINRGQTYDLTFSPDAQLLLATGEFPWVSIIDTAEARVVGLATAFGEEEPCVVLFSADGHYRVIGDPSIAREFVYPAILDDGSHRTFTAEEFQQRFGWRNDPSRVMPSLARIP